MPKINTKVNEKGLSHLTQQYLNKIIVKENENGPVRTVEAVNATSKKAVS
jgi:hypothetical protein